MSKSAALKDLVSQAILERDIASLGIPLEGKFSVGPAFDKLVTALQTTDALDVLAEELSL